MTDTHVIDYFQDLHERGIDTSASLEVILSAIRP